MVVMMQEARVTETYYTPERVKALLRLYPYLGDSRPPTDPELAGIVRRVFGPSGWREEAMAKGADISRAFDWLAARDWRAAYCVRSHYCVRLPLRYVASYLAREDGHEYHHETIRRWTLDSLGLMAQFLNQGDPQEPW